MKKYIKYLVVFALLSWGALTLVTCTHPNDQITELTPVALSTASPSPTPGRGAVGSGTIIDNEQWLQVSQNPSQYLGSKVDLTGKVTNVIGVQDGQLLFQMYTDPESRQGAARVTASDSTAAVEEGELVRVVGTLSDVKAAPGSAADDQLALITADSLEVVEVASMPTVSASPVVTGTVTPTPLPATPTPTPTGAPATPTPAGATPTPTGSALPSPTTSPAAATTSPTVTPSAPAVQASPSSTPATPASSPSATVPAATPTPSAVSPNPSPSVVTTPSPGPTNPPAAAVPSPTSTAPPPTPVASPTVAPPPMPTPPITPSPAPVAPQTLVVGNTGGEGVYVRRTPNMADKIKAWPDGTRMVIVGPDVTGDGHSWKNVRDPDGNVGFVPAEYLGGAPAPVSPPPGPSAPAPAPTQPTSRSGDRPVQPPTAPPGGPTVSVGDTGGEGVYIRRTPNMADKIKAWPDGTKLVVVGPDQQGDGHTWKNVRDPDGNVGYVPAEYVH